MLFGNARLQKKGRISTFGGKILLKAKKMSCFLALQIVMIYEAGGLLMERKVY